MYRAVAYKALQEGIDFNNEAALVELARRIDLRLDCGPTHTRVKVDGHDVSEAIRSMEISHHTSPVARAQSIRELLVEKQREIGQELGSLVTEGRDQGSVVFPHADLKFVLEATLEKRAERRLRELLADGEEVDFEEVLGNLRARDANDARQWAPLLEPGAAIRIDTTRMTIAQVIDRLIAHIRQITGQDLSTSN